jgi:hypothetical protein
MKEQHMLNFNRTASMYYKKVVECLPNNCETLSSIPSREGRGREGEKGQERETDIEKWMAWLEKFTFLLLNVQPSNIFWNKLDQLP